MERIKMKVCFLNFLLICAALFGANSIANGQPSLYNKIADDSIAYVKASTFGKPSVIKKTGKIALAHVRVHFKFITTQAVAARDNSAKVSVYLDGAMTDADLQNLTDEFYAVLQKKLAGLGIEFVDWKAIQNTKYYAYRVADNEDNKKIGGDSKNGQAWLSFTAFGGPTFYGFNPASGFPNDLFAYGKMKRIKEMSEEVGADVSFLDAVVDFTSINLQTNVGTIWKEDGQYKNYEASQNTTAIMSVPVSWAYFFDQKGGFDQYNSKLPVVAGQNFANRLYKDETKAALKTKAFFGDTRFTFVPVVVDADRQLYLNAARRVLEQYADIFVEKMRQLRAGEKPKNSDNKQVAAQNPEDNKTVVQVKEEARKNNSTSAVTYDENMSAAKQAEGEKKWNLAAGYYAEAIKIKPDQFEPYFQRGTIYMNALRDHKAAVADFTKAFELNPNEGASLYNRGTAYVMLSEWKKAIKDFDAFIKIKPDLAEAHLNRGIALLNVKKTDEAIESFNLGMKYNPRLPGLYRARAVAYKVKGDNILAQADELRAAQIESGR